MTKLTREQLDEPNTCDHCDGSSPADCGWCAGVTFTPARPKHEPAPKQPIPMFLTCPKCNARHIDEGEFATKHHHTHSCQSCGLTWRPAVEPTVGVAFLPGFKNAEESAEARNAKLTELLETLVYWAERGSIDQSWWDEAKSLLGGRP